MAKLSELIINFEWFNDLWVRLRIKNRSGLITEMEYIDTSYVCIPNISETYNHMCVQSNVTQIKYAYSWIWPPFKKVTSAIKRETPFEKHTNPHCEKYNRLHNELKAWAKEQKFTIVLKRYPTKENPNPPDRVIG